MIDPNGVVAAWISGVLAGDGQMTTLAPGGVHEGVVPQGVAAFPSIVLRPSEDAPMSAVSVVGGEIVLWQGGYEILALDRDTESYVAAEQAAARAANLLHLAQQSLGVGWQVDACRWVGSGRGQFDISGVPFRGVVQRLHLVIGQA